MIRTGSNLANNSGYLLLKASALQIPLRDASVALVIATPPDLGSKRFGKAGFCTSDSQEFQQLMKEALAECVRVAKPYGYILVAKGRGKGNSCKIFDILQKRSGGKRGYHRIGSQSFHVRYVDVKGFHWEALPVSFYRMLIRRYSAPGEYIAHVFSGSGNSGIAAMQLGRTFILIDLHYHRQTHARLNRKLHSPKIRTR